MKVRGVHHVSVNVDDVEAAVTFYTTALGLSLRPDRPDFGFAGAWLDVGTQQLHLIETSVPADHGQHFALFVEDLDVAVAELRAGGSDVTDPVPVGSSRQAFLHDPAGNRIELHEPADR